MSDYPGFLFLGTVFSVSLAAKDQNLVAVISFLTGKDV
jgi:hypothetical protein